LAASSIPSYPADLLWNGRAPDQNFDLDELLFYRVPEVDDIGKIGSIDVIFCPNTSVNRGKYSKPVYSLYARMPKFLDWRVMEFRVGDIPDELEHPDKRRFQFRIAHDPVKPPEELDENYAHAEIRAWHKDERPKRLPGLVEKEYRQILADIMQLVPPERMNP
jgi:hypothetical protein